MSNPAILRPHVLDAIVYNRLARIVEDLNTLGDRVFFLTTTTSKFMGKTPDQITVMEKVSEVPVDPFTVTLPQNETGIFTWDTAHPEDNFKTLGVEKKYFFKNIEEKEDWLSCLYTCLEERVKYQLTEADEESHTE